MKVLPFGSWPSPITAALLVEQAVSLSQIHTEGDRIWWAEGRPGEGGRQVVVTWAPGEEPCDVLPPPWSARTTVHEYGGGAYTVHGGRVLFSNFNDQRMYRVDAAGEEPRPLTPEPRAPMAVRYADTDVHPGGDWMACVRERHLDGEVVNDVVALDAGVEGEPGPLAWGHDFFSAPRFSSDGRSSSPRLS